MKVFGGVAPENLASYLTTAYAFGMTGYCAVRDAPAMIRERARSWYEGSESAEILHLTKGFAPILCIGTAKSVAALLGLSPEEDVSNLEQARALMRGTLYVSLYGARGILNDGLDFVRKRLLDLGSFNEYLELFLERPVRIVAPPLYLSAMAVYVAVSLLGDYERRH